MYDPWLGWISSGCVRGAIYVLYKEPSFAKGRHLPVSRLYGFRTGDWKYRIPALPVSAAFLCGLPEQHGRHGDRNCSVVAAHRSGTVDSPFPPDQLLAAL